MSLFYDIVTLFHGITMLRCLYLTFWWHFLLMSLLYDVLLHYDITLHHYNSTSWHCDMTVILWCLNIVTLLPYFMTSLHYDIIMLWCKYFIMLYSIMTSLHYIVTLGCNIIMLHYKVIVIWYYVITLCKCNVIILCQYIMLTSLHYIMISLCYASIITLCYDFFTLCWNDYVV